MHSLLNSSCGQVAPELRPYTLTYTHLLPLFPVPLGLAARGREASGYLSAQADCRLDAMPLFPSPRVGGWTGRRRLQVLSPWPHAPADAIAFLPQSSRPLVRAGEQGLSSVGDSIRTGSHLLSVTCPASQCCLGLAWMTLTDAAESPGEARALGWGQGGFLESDQPFSLF